HRGYCAWRDGFRNCVARPLTTAASKRHIFMTPHSSGIRTARFLMFSVTESVADFLFNLSNIVLILGAAAVLAGTIGAITMGLVKEQFSNERIAANERETARAKADAEIAKEGAAKANQRAAEAQLELERIKAPRSLDSEQQRQVESAIVQ